MRIRYIQDFTDDQGYFFPNGCVSQHSASESLRRIALGVAEATNQSAFLRRYPPSNEVSTMCMPEALATEVKAENIEAGEGAKMFNAKKR